MTVLKVILFLAIYQCYSVAGQTAHDAMALHEQLFLTNGYNKRVRPTMDHTNATDIFVDFHLLAINEVNTVDQTLRLTAFLNLRWTDEFLTWDPVDYGGLNYYFWPQNEVWKPVIALRNSFLDYKALGDQSLDIQNDEFGEMTWMPFQVFTSTCSMNVRYYPFDEQTCDVRFVALGYTKEELAWTLKCLIGQRRRTNGKVQMLAGNESIVLDEYEPNSQWDLIQTTLKVQYSPVDVTIIFTLKLRRVPGYVIFTVLIPVLLLTVLNIFVFVLPCESGERVGYAVTVFLSFAVFFTLISSVLPESVALFTIYVIVMTSQSALICLIAIIEVKLSFTSEEALPVPRWLALIAKTGRCHCFRFAKRKKKVEDTCTKTTPIKIIQDEDKTMTVEEVDGDEKKDFQDGEGDNETWKNTVIGIDYLLTFLFTLFSFFITVITIVICATS